MSGTRNLCSPSSRMTVCRGTTTLRRERFVTWQFNGRSQARSARKARPTISVSLLSRRVAVSNENRFLASSYRNLRMLTNTKTGAECIRTGVSLLGKKNDSHASKLPVSPNRCGPATWTDNALFVEVAEQLACPRFNCNTNHRASCSPGWRTAAGEDRFR